MKSRDMSMDIRRNKKMGMRNYVAFAHAHASIYLHKKKMRWAMLFVLMLLLKSS